MGTRKPDTQIVPQREETAKAPYKLRSRPKNDESSEDEDEIKGRKQVSFEDEDPQPRLKITHGEPLAEMRDI